MKGAQGARIYGRGALVDMFVYVRRYVQPFTVAVHSVDVHAYGLARRMSRYD